MKKATLPTTEKATVLQENLEGRRNFLFGARENQDPFPSLQEQGTLSPLLPPTGIYNQCLWGN
jgi:hypothetical protein